MLFGATYPDPKYDPNCDFTGLIPYIADWTIDMRDIALVASLFGTGG